MNLIRISESDNWIVDYDKERCMYRVSYFEDNHFADECWFDAYEEKECALTKVYAKIIPELDIIGMLKDLENLSDEEWEQLRDMAIDNYNACVEKYSV